MIFNLLIYNSKDPKPFKKVAGELRAKIEGIKKVDQVSDESSVSTDEY